MSETVFASAKLIDDSGNRIPVAVVTESKHYRPSESEFIDIIVDYDNETPDLRETQRLKLTEISFPVGMNSKNCCEYERRKVPR